MHRSALKNYLILPLLITTAIILTTAARTPSQSFEPINNNNNSTKSKSNFFFHKTNNNNKKSQAASHSLINRNAAVVAAVSSRNLKQKQSGLIVMMTTTTTTATPTPRNGDHVMQVNVTAKVGETVMLACVINGLNNPGVIWMQGNLGNVLTLNTNRITVDQRFEIVQQPLPTQTFQMSHREKPMRMAAASSSSSSLSAEDGEIDDEHLISDDDEEGEGDETAGDGHPHGNQNEINNYYHLKITNVQLYDENEYACTTSITKMNEDQPNLHSLVFLHVTQSPSYIESLTSESNLAVVEYEDAVLKCFAVGKPVPKIRWYQIDESTGSIRDLNHESTSLTIKNISKNDDSKYECVAGNGILPSVSKKFTVTVYFAPKVKPILQRTNQFMEQTVALGCMIISNPESTITWSKLNQTVVMEDEALNRSENVYTEIDATNSKYQIHKHKQINQTVSYLKIKNLELSDYTKYKCEAVNIVGKSDTIIELLEIKETPKHRPNPNRAKSSENGLAYESVNSNSVTTSDEEIELDDGQYYINLESERGQNSIENEYQLVTRADQQKNSNLTTNRKKLTKYNTNNFLHHTDNSRNKTLLKYQLNKSNRIVNTNRNEDDSENNLNRINDFLSSKSCSMSVKWTMLIFSTIIAVLKY